MLEPFRNPDDESIRKLLESVRRIAVVGLSPKPYRDSHRVARYLLDYPGARRAAAAGAAVVMDRCLMVDHARLLGRNWTRP
jgi:predicted CoA-binding protein